jgi:cytochrome c oxidase assembly protein subunit 15
VPSARARLTALWRGPIRPETYRKITVVALVALGAIVVSGAAVRLTGSGLGCPTWPQCESGSLVPRGETGGHGWVEFLNRVFTGFVSVAVALAVLGSRRRQPRRDDLTRLSWLLVAGVFAQALLGGLVVVLDVAPLAVAGHFLLSAALLFAATLLHHRAAEPDGPRRARATPALLRRSRGLVALAGLVLLTGTFVTGSGPHGGDEAADRYPFSVTTVARVHSLTVWAFLVVVVLVLRSVTRGDADPAVLGRGRLLIGLILAQGFLGYVQYATGVPETLVAGHVLGAVLVWISAVDFHLGLTEPLPAVEPGDAVAPVVPQPAS